MKMAPKSLKVLFAGVMLAFSVSHAQAQAFDAMAVISSTMGVSSSRVCIGEGTRGDLGCPTYAPYVTSAGRVGINGTDTIYNLQVNNGTMGINSTVSNTALYIAAPLHGAAIQATDSANAVTKFLTINPLGGNVGVGLTYPSASLHVNGGIKISQDASATTNTCDANRAGAIRWNGAEFQTCFGSGGWATLANSSVSGTMSKQVAFGVNKNGTNQTVVANTFTKISWGNEIFDTNNNFASDRFTPTVPGKYVFNASVYCYPGSNNGCHMAIYKNGSLAAYGVANTANGMPNTSAILDMNGSTDYVEVWGYADAGTTINGTNGYTYFTGALINARGADGSGGGATTLSGLTDVSLAGPSNGQALVYNGSAWTNSSAGLSSDRLVSGSAVALLGPSGTLNVRGALDIVTGTASVEIGNGAGFTNTGTYLTALGYNSAYYNSGNNLTAVGVNAGINNSAAFVTAVGQAAAQANSGTHLTAMGYLTGQFNTGTHSTLLGNYAGNVNKGDQVTSLGYASGWYNIGTGATLIGYGAGIYNSGSVVTAVGLYANQNLTGAYNTSIGGYAGRGTSGSMQSVTGTTALGYMSGYNLTTNGSYNTLLGYAAGDNITSGASNIIIGASIDAMTSTGSNQLNIGDTIYGDMSANRIGIATNAPSRTLDLDGNFRAFSNSTWPTITSEALSATAPAYFIAKTTRAGSALLSSDNIGVISFRGAVGESAYIHSMSGANHTGSSTPGDLNFSTTSPSSIAAINRMRIMPNGYVGIGTTNPQAMLHISATTANDNGLRIDNGLSKNVILAYAPGGVLTHNVYTSGNTAMYAMHSGGTENVRLNAGGYGFITNPFSFGTNTAPYGSTLHARGSNWAGEFYTTAGAGAGIPVAMRRDNTGYYSIFYNNGWSTQVGNIYYDGALTQFNTSSDYRLKEHIRKVDGALDKVIRLNPVEFSFISDTSHKMVEGFLAHEVQQVAPYAVTGKKDALDKDGKPEYQSMDYGKLTPLLTAAVQELKKENDVLKARVESLEARMEALEKK